MAKKTNPLTSYGYPKPRQIRKQAKQLAAASVTPASQIRKQYARAQGDASGFTQALVSLLGGQQSAYTGAANDALAQQQAIDSSAVSRLGGIDPAYQGAQVATGALGDSAASRQISQGEALKGYGAQQPGIAASRGALAQIGLTNAMMDALDQRRTQLHQAYQQALPQVQQNALSMATAAANISQANKGLALQYAQLHQQNHQFNQSQAETIREFNLSRKDAKAKAKADAAAGGFTNLQIQTIHGDIYDAIQSAKAGTPAMGSHHQLHKGGPTGPKRWRVPPAPKGAPNEPGQVNSIFNLYTLFSNHYSDPSLQRLILTELRAAYPPATWRIFVSQMTGNQNSQHGKTPKSQRHR